MTNEAQRIFSEGPEGSTLRCRTCGLWKPTRRFANPSVCKACTPESGPTKDGTMATAQTETCRGHAHPIPTAAEQARMSAALVEAAQAIDRAWGSANRTPSYHWLTDELGPIMAELVRLQRIA